MTKLAISFVVILSVGCATLPGSRGVYSEAAETYAKSVSAVTEGVNKNLATKLRVDRLDLALSHIQAVEFNTEEQFFGELRTTLGGHVQTVNKVLQQDEERAVQDLRQLRLMLGDLAAAERSPDALQRNLQVVEARIDELKQEIKVVQNRNDDQSELIAKLRAELAIMRARLQLMKDVVKDPTLLVRQRERLGALAEARRRTYAGQFRKNCDGGYADRVLHFFEETDHDVYASMFTCRGVGSLPQIQSPLALLSKHAGTLSAASSDPPEDIADLRASTAKYKSETGKQLSLGTARFAILAQRAKADCLSGVLDLLEYMHPAQFQPIGPVCPDDWPFAKPSTETVEAIVAGFKTVKAALGKLKGLAVSLLKFVDEATRAEFIQTYITDNASIVESALDALELSAMGLDNFDRLGRRAALAEAYFALQEWPAIESRSDAMSKASSAHQKLASFDDWRASGGASINTVAIRAAHAELQRLAAGDLSPEEYFDVLKSLRDSLKAIEEAADAVKSM